MKIPKKPARTILLLALITCLSYAPLLQAQRGSESQQLSRAADRSRQQEARLANDPFVGITENGSVQKGLFEIESTGVSTDSIQKAAEAFIDTLSESQKKDTLHPIDSPEWRQWMNQHSYVRWGIGFNEMGSKQRELGFDLLRSSLSDEGFKLARDIMRLNHTLGEMSGRMQEYGEWAYWITIMGEPSATEPWGWQIDGHHLIINFFILRDQIVATPTFVGSEPVIAEDGKFKGVTILQDEQNKALAFAQSLTPKQQSKAIIRHTKPGNDNQTEAWKDNTIIPYEGIPVSELNNKQTQALLEVIGLYTGYMNDGHAKVRMSEIKEHWDDTYFAWRGPTDDNAVFYYRIHSPVALIEFDHQNPVGIRRQFPERKPIRQHIHAVIRTPNGNDYGKDLLRQHREKHHSH
ncbi:MAG: DUF3500 domain-containing protein [Opitutales bacterium]|nr:DUF3500 domain-containing protein [Opitutales bacterium]